MAIALEDANLVWQKVKISLDSLGADFSTRESLRKLKEQLASRGVKNLQFIAFDATSIIADGGFCPDVDACSLYAVYAKGARTTGTTVSFVSVHDAATNGATTTTVDTARFSAVGQAFLSIRADGFAIATDLTVAATTTVGGATESSAADAANGFLIIGA